MPTAPLSNARSRYWNPLIAGALLVLAAIAAYHNSFSGPFVYDDVPAIKDNPTIKQLWPLTTVLSPPNDSGITVNGRPLLNLSFALNYAFGGLDVTGYHAVNLAIHILAGLALFGLVRRTLLLPALRGSFGTGDAAILPALAVAALWTLHPLQTSSVTYIVQRAESQGGLFFLLTFYCFVRSVDSPNPRLWQTLTFVACLCGMGSKEVVAAAPVLILFFDRAVVSGTFQAAWKRHSPLYVGLAVTWIPLGWLILNSNNRGGTAGFGAGDVSSWHYLLTSAYAIGRYLRLSFWPEGLVFDYGTAVKESLLPVLPQSLLIVSLALGTFYALWRRPLLGFLGLWFFAILAPSSSILPVASETITEHRMYLSLAALITLVVLGAAARFGRTAIVACLALAPLAAGLTYQRNKVYRDELTLWQDAQRTYPSNARAHNNVGEILFRHEKRAEAIACFYEAVRLLPNYIDALNNLGNSLTQQGQEQEALAHLELALRLKPGYAETHNNLGNTFYRLGRKDEAVAHYRDAVRLKPEFADARNNLGVLLAEIGYPQEAIVHYEKALSLRPDYVDAHYNYANALTLVGRTDEARVQFEKTLRLKPDQAKAHNNLGSLLVNLGKMAEAKPHFEAAIRHNGNYADAENNLGVVLFQTGRPGDALPHFEAAVRLNPTYQAARENLAEVRNNLGAQHAQTGDLAAARIQFEAAVNANPANAGAHNNLGVVLWRQGQLAEALPRFREAVRLKPDFADAQKSLADLTALLARSAP